MATLRCKRCNQYADIKTMRYEKTGSYLVCEPCRLGKKPETKKEPQLSSLIDRPFGGAKILKYQCTSCRYIFRRTTTHPVNKCPNCEGTKLIRYEKVTANDLVDMADDPRFSGL